MPKEEMTVDHLFRHESGKMVAVLTKLFGFDRLEIAEDLVQDTFIQAVETWKIKGNPDNPQAWLYKVAKNKATDYLRRQQTRRKIDDQLKYTMPVEYFISGHLEKAFQTFDDSQLQMLFSICHPSIPTESQIALALKTLGGFGIQEIANAFLTNKEVINKRLFRAKEKIKKEQIQLEMPAEANVDSRLENVLRTIYLLFNEGYYSQSDEAILRKDLCLEAMRLGLLLSQSKLERKKDIHALLALMCFHASRFESRISEGGELVPWNQQDREKWNIDLLNQGQHFLILSNPGEFQSKYQIEAAISYYHTIPDSDTKWKGLKNLYDKLTRLSSNPMILLSQAFVLSKVDSPEIAIQFLEKNEKVEKNHLYHLVMAELTEYENPSQSLKHLNSALEKAPLNSERVIIEEK